MKIRAIDKLKTTLPGKKQRLKTIEQNGGAGSAAGAAEATGAAGWGGADGAPGFCWAGSFYLCYHLSDDDCNASRCGREGNAEFGWVNVEWDCRGNTDEEWSYSGKQGFS